MKCGVSADRIQSGQTRAIDRETGRDDQFCAIEADQ